jgi:hypothetical protein
MSANGKSVEVNHDQPFRFSTLGVAALVALALLAGASGSATAARNQSISFLSARECMQWGTNASTFSCGVQGPLYIEFLVGVGV